MKLTLLGTGTPLPSMIRQSSGYFLQVGDDRLILDHGPGAHHRLVESGVKATDITHALFSHLHFDHFLDYQRLIFHRWDTGAGHVPDLLVFGPPPIRRQSDALFGPGGVWDEDLISRTEHPASKYIYSTRGGALPRQRPAPVIQEVGPGDVIKGNGWTAKVGLASHFQPYLECYGYRIEGDGASLCYAGDSGGVTQTVIDLAMNCDVLIHMMCLIAGTEPNADCRMAGGTHLDVAEVAKRANVKTLIVTHATQQLHAPGTRERITAEMLEIYKGQLIWGEDLMTFPVPYTPYSRPE